MTARLNISVVEHHLRVEDEGVWTGAHGVLRIGDRVVDDFTPQTDVWSLAMYEAQWTGALERLRCGANKDCLVIGLWPPDENPNVHIYGIWRVGDELKINERFILLEDHPQGVIPERAHEYMEEYSPFTEDGEEPEYWTFPANVV